MPNEFPLTNAPHTETKWIEPMFTIPEKKNLDFSLSLTRRIGKKLLCINK